MFKHTANFQRTCYRTSLIVACFLVVTAQQPIGAATTDQHIPPVRFQQDVLPILSDHCFICHGPDEQTRQADLRLDQEESIRGERESRIIVNPGQPDESLLIARVFSDSAKTMMPPPDAHLALTADEKEVLRRWIEEGATWEQHWAFIPPVSPSLPEVQHRDWPRNPIDHYVLRRLEESGLTPSAEADRETLIRRVTFDLTGLPPTLTAIDEFLADDRPDAYERVVDRLLASPRYGERMAFPWLEAARFADSDGYQYDGPRSMWRWRDWVIDAFNNNMPFDQFTIEQLAGDLLPQPTIEQRVATGFNRNHRYNSESGLVVEEFLLENAVDRVDTTSTVWLGLTAGCARCHDHKYDPISQNDYYQLIAFFNNVPEAGRAIKAGNSEPYIIAPTKSQQAELTRHDQSVRDAEALFTTPEYLQAQHNWEQSLARGDHDHSLDVVSHDVAEMYHFDAGLPPRASAGSGAPLIAPGLFGAALQLDGQSTLRVANKLPDDEKKTRFSGFGCHQKFTLSFWVRPSRVDQGVIVSRQSAGMARKGLSVELQDGKVVFSLISNWIAGAGVVQTRQSLAPEQWSHLIVSNDGSQRATAQKIYIDGKLAATDVLINTNSNSGDAPKSAPLLLGDGPHGPHFDGKVDEFRYYRREIRQEEAIALSARQSVKEIAAIARLDRTVRQDSALQLAFREHGPFDKEHQAYLQAVAEREKFVSELPTCMVMQEAPETKPTHVRVRGAYNVLGERVQRNVPDVLPPLPEDAPKNRLGFARWIVSKDNPLTARVTVNRYWQQYFGVGLVKTSEDFGVQGERPSHPELLDWLATQFVASGWDVKAMQKLILTSATYRQQSHLTDELRRHDPHNRLMARGPRTRLPAAMIRDQALFLGDLLVERVGGPSVRPYQPPNLWIEMSMGLKYKQSQGDDLFRRSLYTTWKRTVNPPGMAILDAADRESCWVRVKRTNTPLQALTLLNETAFVESARHLGEHLLRGEGDPIATGYRMTTGHYPSDRQRQILTEALESYRVEFRSHPDRATKLLAVGSTPSPDDLDAAELAAHTVLANVLLNLDQVITKE